MYVDSPPTPHHVQIAYLDQNSIINSMLANWVMSYNVRRKEKRKRV